MLMQTSFQVYIDDAATKILLENNIQYIKERILFARGLNHVDVKLKDGTKMDRIAWILESEKEMLKLELELGKIIEEK
jgi:hypothetical protein